MNSQPMLYVMLSRTGTGIGKAIRWVTRFEYNHVSLCVDPELRRWVSFARYVQDVPLAGGFVPESPERLCADGPPRVKIFAFPITKSRRQVLDALFRQAGQPDSGLVYDSFGPLADLLGCRLHIPGAYTCLDFANAVLGTQCPSLQALDAYAADHLLYQGLLPDLVPDSGQRTDPYFSRRSLAAGIGDTLVHFSRLCCRMALRRGLDPIQRAAL